MKIEDLRKYFNLTQTQLADRLGIGLRTVQNYEKSGEIPESVKKLIKYEFSSYFANEISAELHDSPAEYLLTPNKLPVMKKTIDPQRYDAVVDALIKAQDSISELTKAVLILSMQKSEPDKKQAG